MQEHCDNLLLDSHSTCIKDQTASRSSTDNANPMRPMYPPPKPCIHYNNKLQVGIKRGRHATTLTRILRSHLVGHPIHWNTGVFATKQHPTQKTEDDLGRLNRLSSFMRSFIHATESQPTYHEARASAKLIKHSIDQWSEKHLGTG